MRCHEQNFILINELNVIPFCARRVPVRVSSFFARITAGRLNRNRCITHFGHNDANARIYCLMCGQSITIEKDDSFPCTVCAKQNTED